jgi:hypothetical protein
MENEFIPYEQALALKELGFNEPCFKKYIAGCLWSNPTTPEIYKNIHANSSDCITPLYQQVFRWFREKYKVSPIITCYSELGNVWKYHIPNEGGEQGFNTYEEAELACLKKLIEIIKKK